MLRETPPAPPSQGGATELPRYLYGMARLAQLPGAADADHTGTKNHYMDEPCLQEIVGKLGYLIALW